VSSAEPLTVEAWLLNSLPTSKLMWIPYKTSLSYISLNGADLRFAEGPEGNFLRYFQASSRDVFLGEQEIFILPEGNKGYVLD